MTNDRPPTDSNDTEMDAAPKPDEESALEQVEAVTPESEQSKTDDEAVSAELEDAGEEPDEELADQAAEDASAEDGEAPADEEPEPVENAPTPDAMFGDSISGDEPIDLDAGEYTDEEYEELLAMYEDTLHDIVEGEIVKATVLRKTDNAVILDVGFKSEGSVPLDEFRDPENLQDGDEVEVFLESLEDSEGVVVLSKKKADFLRVWEKIKDAYDNDRPVPGVLKRKIKGGVTVDVMGACFHE